MGNVCRPVTFGTLMSDCTATVIVSKFLVGGNKFLVVDKNT